MSSRSILISRPRSTFRTQALPVAAIAAADRQFSNARKRAQSAMWGMVLEPQLQTRSEMSY